MPEQTVYERIYAAVARVPEGHVSTYGRIAEAIGRRGQARQVGYALAALPRDRALRILFQKLVLLLKQVIE